MPSPHVTVTAKPCFGGNVTGKAFGCIGEIEDDVEGVEVDIVIVVGHLDLNANILVGDVGGADERCAGLRVIRLSRTVDTGNLA